ncbi:MAG: hypothetical protein M1827_002519 [Pycnora praestabilis]|nr:MAG: hypothetical protein M1827_002519 [Pycnora praestabilis]
MESTANLEHAGSVTAAFAVAAPGSAPEQADARLPEEAERLTVQLARRRFDDSLFEEEACRDFLRELGTVIVRKFTYTAGRDLIHEQLILRYGDANIGDAIGVFKELLEDDDASGLGDDGDIYRSWRHEYKTCGLDFSSPGTPRFPNLILPAPRRRDGTPSSSQASTPTSTGYPWHQPLIVSAGAPSGTNNPSRILQRSRAQSSSAPRSGLGQAPTLAVPSEANWLAGRNIRAGEVTGESESSIISQAAQSDKSFNIPKLLQRADPAQQPSVRSTLSSKMSDLFIKTKDKVKPQKPAEAIVPTQENTKPRRRYPSALGPGTPILPFAVEVEKSERSVNEHRIPRLRFDGRQMREQTLRERRASARKSGASTVKPDTVTETLGLASPEAVSDRISEIFDSEYLIPPLTFNGVGAQVRGSRERNPSTYDHELPAMFSDITNEASGLPAQTADLSSVSEEPDYEYCIPPPTFSGTVAQEQASLYPSTQRPRTLTRNSDKMIEERDNKPRIPPVTFDGAADEWEDDRISKPIDLHRHLPPVSSNTRHSPPTFNSEEAEVNLSHKSATKRSTTSTTQSSGNQFTGSGRHHFRTLTRELLTPATEDPSVDMHSAFGRLDPAKFSPPPSRDSNLETTDAYSHYLSIANANPFTESHHTRWPDLSEAKTRSKSPDVPFMYKPKGMSQSRSEGSIAIMTGPNPINTSKANVFNKTNAYAEGNTGEVYPIRGRSRSPTKYMEKIKEDGVIDFPKSPTKRSGSPLKKMFGENGWLGRSTSLKDMSKEQSKKIGLKQLGDKIKQRVEDIVSLASCMSEPNICLHIDTMKTEDVSKMLPNPFNSDSTSKQQVVSKFPISLDPPAQAKLYSELELMICATANEYLMIQHHQGRMSVESITKIIEYWNSKGRPQVIEFQFDQATQRDLILHNLKSFRFYGDNAEKSVALNSMMYNWKAVAKEMAVRTFCTPDSVIKKHMHDIHKILELLGAPLVTFLAFQEIQVRALKVMREEQKKREARENIQYGVEKVWNPPPRVDSKIKRSVNEAN